MKGDAVARDEGGGAAAVEADAAAAKEAEAGRRGSNASSDTMLDKTRVGEQCSIPNRVRSLYTIRIAYNT
jgi:hypothetical protein